MLDAPAFITGFNNVAMIREAVEQCGRHFGITEYAGESGELIIA